MAGRLREIWTGPSTGSSRLDERFWYDYGGKRVKKEDTPLEGIGHAYYALWSGDKLLIEYQTIAGGTFPPGTQPEQTASTDDPVNLRYLHRDQLSVRMVTNG